MSVAGNNRCISTGLSNPHFDTRRSVSTCELLRIEVKLNLS